MPENSGGIIPLDWQALVDEAKRRRKAEKLTQKEHAALAGVSIPTMISFERGEETLTLGKAFDILRVVGLVRETDRSGVQANFVKEAFARWRRLTAKLSEDSPGRFADGWYRIDYELVGDLRDVSLTELEEFLAKAKVRHTGWAMFWIPTRPEITPREIDGTLECWHAPNEIDKERMFDDPAHCDFWRAAPEGRMFLMRGYQEDSVETFPPRTIFDTTLVIWRLSEALLHANRMALLMRRSEGDEITVKLRAMYTGLTGRILRSWANPQWDPVIDRQPARSDECVVETITPATSIEDRLAHLVFPLVTSIYERFGVTGIPFEAIEREVRRFRQSRV
ncbi:MAG: helix-turn-helix domain-containing protein [Parvibaculum sp.]|nr:helix-turn-helix domain-containing protein [Parvibaculum sp.]